MRVLRIGAIATWFLCNVTMTISQVAAQNLLLNGGFEAPSVLDGWNLDESITGMPGMAINSAQLEDFANQPMSITGELGLWLRSFEGNLGSFMGQNLRINADLSQTVAVTAGETYTFSGWSRWESNYSGGTSELDPTSPSGFVPSPTDSTFEMVFLDSGGAAVGAPVALDLETVQFGDNTWRQHSLMSAAPAGATQVRVSAAATDMVFNLDPGQSGFYDNFSLASMSAPGTELLVNPNLNAPSVTPAWAIMEGPGTADTLAIHMAGFAQNTNSTGGTGVWLRAFATTNPEGDASVSQTVAGVEGGEYTLSAWSKWEANYSGGIAGPTQTLLELSFLDGSNAVIGTPSTLDLRMVQMNDNTWRQHFLTATAPVGTVNVRVSGQAIDMFSNPGASQSAFFDDFLLTLAPMGLAGDYNGDGVVDAADYVVWRDNLGAMVTLLNEGTNVTPGAVTQEDYDFWRSRFGDSLGSGSLVAGSIPEPSSLLLIALFSTVFAVRLRSLRYVAESDLGSITDQ